MSKSRSSSDSSEPPETDSQPPSRPEPSSPTHVDAIVVGLGAMGLATCRALARRGLRTIGLEQFDLFHDQGCSHGSTRIFRRAFAEGPDYGPLVDRAHELWRELETESGLELLNACGVLTAGPKQGPTMAAVLSHRSQQPYESEVLSADQIRERFPGIDIRQPGEVVGVFEPASGYLYAERALEALADSARTHGATLCDCHHVSGWREEGDRVVVETEEGAFEADFLILTTGPWAKPLLANYGIDLTLLRKLVFWYLPEREQLIRAGTMPCYRIESPYGLYYGVPDNQDTPEEGLKIGRHDHTPDLLDVCELESGEEMRVERWVDDQEDRVRPMVEQFARETFAPALLGDRGGDLVPGDMAVRQYSMSPDGHFIIDRLPDHRRVAIAAGFCGHGFKFAPVIGEVLAEMAEGRPARAQMHFARMGRFAGSRIG